MTIRSLALTFTLSAALALPAGLAAQDAESVPLGEPYAVSTHRDWEVQCSRFTEDGPELCEMYQLLLDESGSPISEISLAVLPEGEEFVAGATITVPLETLLPAGLGFRIGEAEQMRVEPYRVCNVVGCIVRMGLRADEIEAMRRGSNAWLMMIPFLAPDQPVQVRISLLGFTAAFDETRQRLEAALAAGLEITE